MTDLRDHPKLFAAYDLLRRTGASTVQLRYQDDEQPTVWIAVVTYRATTGWDCAAGRDPLNAVLRLCESVIDGGVCKHCRRPTAFDADSDDTVNEAMTGGAVCWYMWDPELAKFRRGCE